MGLGIDFKRRKYEPEIIRITLVRLHVDNKVGSLDSYSAWVGGFQQRVTSPGKLFGWDGDLYYYSPNDSSDRTTDIALTYLELRTFCRDVGDVTWPVNWTVTFNSHPEETWTQTREGHNYYIYSFSKDNPLVIPNYYKHTDFPTYSVRFSCATNIPITPNQGSTGYTYGWGFATGDALGWYAQMI